MDYNEYMEIHKRVINKYSNELNETEVNNLINIINDMNINEDNLKEFNPLNNENLSYDIMDNNLNISSSNSKIIINIDYNDSSEDDQLLREEDNSILKLVNRLES